ncbi:BatA domain-containing protein [Algoriphagus confluentis]|uniref:Aerotolerance regulator N-terminal domain-containing protein n=1 Tax=Algoriphagus confluentis TaxID=1697556 RepID=A0ABQ6PIG9_9BACT|nr:hypothetical protein Aconfl_02830 [Algoriphagus confluentis]
MEWIQPNLLWGLLGLTIPVLIHLWNGKKGKVIAWAAFPWLDPKESQSSRSIKLENWLLLLIRILLLAMLVFLLAGLIWKGFGSSREYKVVHLIWPDEQVEAEFRFELNQAAQKGQEVRWIGTGLPEYGTEQVLAVDFSQEKLQDYLDELNTDLDSIYLYTSLQSSFFPKETYWLPQNPVIRMAENYLPNGSNPAVSLESGEFLELDQNGILVKTATKGNAPKTISGQISYAFGAISEERKASIQKALSAISEVYGFHFNEGNLNTAELLFLDSLTLNFDGNKLVFLSENQGDKISNQVLVLSNSVNLNWEETVEKGLLPEQILEGILANLGMEKPDLKITKTQLEKKFLAIPSSKLSKTANLNEVLLVLLVILFAVERFLAYRANL